MDVPVCPEIHPDTEAVASTVERALQPTPHGAVFPSFARLSVSQPVAGAAELSRYAALFDECLDE